MARTDVPTDAAAPAAAGDPTWDRLEDQIAWYDARSGQMPIADVRFGPPAAWHATPLRRFYLYVLSTRSRTLVAFSK